MKTSDSIKEIATALAKAQASIVGAKKDSTNPHYKSAYADLSSVWDAIREPLTKNGIAVFQTTPPSDKEEIGVVTLLMHSSGEWIEGDPFPIPVNKHDAHGVMSALTYARRGSLGAACSVPQIDDDGNLAAQAKPSKNAFGGTTPLHAQHTSQEALDALPKARQDELREHAQSIIHIFNQKGDMAGYVAEQQYDLEAELALSCLLPSLVRNTLKKQQSERRSPAEQA